MVVVFVASDGFLEKEPVSAPRADRPRAEGLGELFAAPSPADKKKKTKCGVFLKILYLVLAVINIVKSVALIAVSVTTAIAIKIFTDEQSGRRVAMIVIAVTAAITLSIAIYSIVAVLTAHTQRLLIASGVLLVLAVLQAVLMALAVRLTAEDEVALSRALADSFRLARDDSPRHVRLWTNIQHDLSCCGVYGPEDYRSPGAPETFAPDVPVSCCPGFDAARSQLVQERERETCRAKREYYEVGCRDPVIELYRDATRTMLGVTVGLIVFMVALSAVGIILSKKCGPEAASPPQVKRETPPRPLKM